MIIHKDIPHFVIDNNKKWETIYMAKVRGFSIAGRVKSTESHARLGVKLSSTTCYITLGKLFEICVPQLSHL